MTWWDDWKATSCLMLDVSHWQADKTQSLVHWPSAARSGVQAAYVKASHGVHSTRATEWHLGGARLAGLKVGLYHWLVWGPALPGEQVRRWLEQRERFTPDLRCAIDVEECESTRGLGPHERLRWVESAVSQYELLTGHYPVLYSGGWFWKGWMGDLASDLLSLCPYWQSEYPSKNPKCDRADLACAREELRAYSEENIPKPWLGIQPAAWQFDGDKGLFVQGKNGLLDVDVNLAQLERLLTPEDPGGSISYGIPEWQPAYSAAATLPEIVPPVPE